MALAPTFISKPMSRPIPIFIPMFVLICPAPTPIPIPMFIRDTPLPPLLPPPLPRTKRAERARSRLRIGSRSCPSPCRCVCASPMTSKSVPIPVRMSIPSRNELLLSLRFGLADRARLRLRIVGPCALVTSLAQSGSQSARSPRSGGGPDGGGGRCDCFFFFFFFTIVPILMPTRVSSLAPARWCAKAIDCVAVASPASSPIMPIVFPVRLPRCTTLP